MLVAPDAMLEELEDRGERVRGAAVEIELVLDVREIVAENRRAPGPSRTDRGEKTGPSRGRRSDEKAQSSPRLPRRDRPCGERVSFDRRACRGLRAYHRGVADDATHAFRSLTEQWSAAARDRDVATIQRLLSEDFLFTSSLSSGGLQNRKQYIDFVTNVLAIESFSFSDFRVRQWPGTAVVHSRYHQLGTILGAKWPAEFLLTDVWIEAGGVWRAVSRHSSQPVTDPPIA